MPRLLAAELFRVTRGRVLWGMLIVLAAVLALEVVALRQGMTDLLVEGHTQAYGSGLVAGGFLPMFAGVFAALGVGRDHDAGFVRTLAMARCGRVGVAAARMASLAVACVAFLAVGVAVLEAGLALAGLGFAAPEDPAQWWAYLGLSVLATFCYGSLALLAAQATRSKVAGIVAAFVVSSSAAGSLLAVALRPLGDAGATLIRWLPTYHLQLMGAGAPALWDLESVGGLGEPVHAALTFALWSAAACAVTLAVAARQDVA